MGGRVSERGGDENGLGFWARGCLKEGEFGESDVSYQLGGSGLIECCHLSP